MIYIFPRIFLTLVLKVTSLVNPFFVGSRDVENSSNTQYKKKLYTFDVSIKSEVLNYTLYFRLYLIRKVNSD